MSDIGSIFSPTDLLLMVLIACAPGTLLGTAIGAWVYPRHRITGGLVGFIAGFAVSFGAWAAYFAVVK
ncbi:hypothetical protein [Rhizobium sp. NRK18]|uniref:hypothetical protein n=1 Tax=Rhizobium sp. NRK18 TaxID=2964667 RepID=UPI0021C39506|nr:hypothetical protein [Rhizobium sp. NRK18]MCQ2004418.1 hypothetical protein [Rhizobium sp. NRK18]